MRFAHGPGRPRQGRRANPRRSRPLRRAAAGGGRDPRRDLPLQEQHRLGGQLVRLPRELPRQPAQGLPPHRRSPDPLPRHPPDLPGCRKAVPDPPGNRVLAVAASGAHLGRCFLGDDPVPPDHQHPGRAPRRCRTVPSPPRHRRRLQHERVRHLREDRHGGGSAPDGRAGRRLPGSHPGESDPVHPGRLARLDLEEEGASGERPGAVGSRHPMGVPRSGDALRPQPRLQPAATASARRCSGRSTCGNTSSPDWRRIR